ncbi:MAG TPA: ABC transporter substrate binding protein [Desulfobacteraceae bacterium]|nr:ABC transporter substrate binding protein [Desulfobacteraceae bacterium]HPJ67786.1 ABC transporter substrate binding protein [Desulfobacteraceae bacterium]HPQ28055.1 ABC transporter substrate binding protein [Desulfobacteraceae bacterium]
MRKHSKFYTFIVIPFLVSFLLFACKSKEHVYSIGLLQWTEMEKIVTISDSAGIPVFPVTKKFAEYGGLMALHCDSYELGRQASDPVKQILDGTEVRSIPSQKPLIKRLTLNLKKAKQLNIEIRRNLILKADNILS